MQRPCFGARGACAPARPQAGKLPLPADARLALNPHREGVAFHRVRQRRKRRFGEVSLLWFPGFRIALRRTLARRRPCDAEPAVLIGAQ